MGLMFMIAGYFVAGSYDRKGFGRFVGDRFRRLVIPRLIYMIAIDPFIGIVELGNKPTTFSITDFLSSTGGDVVRGGALHLLAGLRVGASDRQQASPSF